MHGKLNLIHFVLSVQLLLTSCMFADGIRYKNEISTAVEAKGAAITSKEAPEVAEIINTFSRKSLSGNLSYVFSDINALHFQFKKLPVYGIVPAAIQSHTDPIEILKQIKSLKESLPFQYYFDRHLIGTDVATNAAIVKHLDFESKGRGGLDFKLERLYSSANAYLQRGEFLIYPYLREFYVRYQEALEEMDSCHYENINSNTEETDENIFFGLYRNMFLYISAMYGPRYESLNKEFDRAKGIEELYDVATGYTVLYNGVGEEGYHPITAKIDDDGNLILGPPSHVKDGSYIGEPIPESLKPPAPTIAKHMLMVDRNFYEMKSRVAEFIEEIDAKIHYYHESVIGDGWCFNIPYIEMPDPSSGKPGAIFFDGYRKKEFEANITRKSFLSEKGFLESLDGSPIEIVDDIISMLGYKFQTMDKIFYFNNEGNLKYITDFTRQNAIKFKYKIINQITVISEIIDTAGNTYAFNYETQRGKPKLTNITASYGKTVSYFVKEIGNSGQTFVLKKIKEGNHETSYEYDYSPPIFKSNVVDITGKFFIMTKEINPLGGITNFNFYKPVYASFAAAIYDNDDNTRKIMKYSMARNSGTVERIYRDNNIRDIIVGHIKIKDTGKGSIPRIKTTMRIDKEKIIKNEYRYLNNEWKLWRRGVYTIPKILNDNFGIPMFEKLLSSYHRKLGNPLKTEFYSYNDYNLVESIVTAFGSPSHDDIILQGIRALKREFVYPEDNGGLNTDLLRTYGLPREMIWREHLGDDKILKRVSYEYTYDTVNLRPLIKEISGDTKKISFKYFERYIDFEEGQQKDKDPSRSGKPTTVIESTQNGALKYYTHLFYSRYGNKKKTLNAKGKWIGYEYEDVEDDESGIIHREVFLSRVVRYQDNNPNNQGIGPFFRYNSIGQLTEYRDAKGDGYNNWFDEYGRLKETRYTDGGHFQYVFGDNPDCLLPENTTRIRQRVRSDLDDYYETDITSYKNGNVYRIMQFIKEKLLLEPTRFLSSSVDTEIFYDDVNRVKKIIRNGNASIYFSYDPLDRMFLATNYRDGSTEIVYDDIVKLRNIQGRIIPLKKKAVKNPEGHKRVFYYDLKSRLRFAEMEFQAYGWTETKKIYWEYNWDQRDRLVWIKDPDNVVTHYVYDDFDRIIERHVYVCINIPSDTPPPYNHSGQFDDVVHVRERFQYNSLHQIEFIFDRNENKTHYLYDPRDRLERIELPENNLTIFGMDDNNNITSVNHNQRTTIYGYDGRNQVNYIKDPEENITTRVYDHLGRLVSETFETEHGTRTRSWEYNSRGYLIKRENEEGNIWQWGYDRTGLSWSIEPRGELTIKTYTTNNAGDVLSIENNNKEVTEFVRNKLGRIKKVIIHALGLVYSRRFNAFNQVESMTYPDNSTWLYHYDAVGRRVQIESPEGRTDTTYYDFLGRIYLRFKGDHGDEFKYIRDKNDNIRMVLYRGNPLAQYTYDKLNRVKTLIPYIPIHGLIDEAKIVYDYEDKGEFGSSVKITNAYGKKIIIVKDRNDRVTRFLTPKELEEPSPGNIVEIEEPDQIYQISLFDYNERGSIKQLRMYKGKIEDEQPADSKSVYTEIYTYWPTNRLKSITFGDGSMVTYHYDPNGNRSKIILKKNAEDIGKETKFLYTDVFDLPTDITGSDGFNRTLEYDALGRPKLTNFGSPVIIKYNDKHRKVTYRLLSEREYILSFSQDGNLIELKKPDASSITFGYDYANRINYVKNTLNDEFKYTYGPFGYLERMLVRDRDSGDFRVKGQKNTYYPNGSINIIQHENGITKYYYGINTEVINVEYGYANSGLNPLRVAYQYYDDASIKSAQYSNGVTKFYEYDHTGNIVEVREKKQVINKQGVSTTEEKTVTYKRNERARVEREYVDGNQTAIFEYAPEGFISKINEIHYIQKLRSSLLDEVRIVRPDNTVELCLKYNYYPNGWLKKFYSPDGYSREFFYDLDGRIEAIEIEQHGQLLTKYIIHYDPNGNPFWIQKIEGTSSKITAYEFNSEDQLISINPETDKEISFRYDETGNLEHEEHVQTRTVIDRNYNWSNQLIDMSISHHVSKKFTFDSRGNLVKINDMVSEEVSGFDYDLRNRLVANTIKGKKDSKERIIKLFGYDAIDRLYSDKDALKNFTHYLTHAGVFPIRLLTGEKRHDIIPDVNDLNPLVIADEDGYRLPTWLFGVGTDVHTTQGRLLGTLKGMPYGKLISGDLSLNPFWYKGYFRTQGNEHTGMDWTGTRFYSWSLKQFLSQDKLPGNSLKPISMNRRRTFSANPVTIKDILGLQDISELSITAFWQAYEDTSGNVYSYQSDLTGINELIQIEQNFNIGEESYELSTDLSGWYQTLNYLPDVQHGGVFTRFDGTAWDINADLLQGWIDVYGLFDEFITGTGPKYRTFDESSRYVRELSIAPGVKRTREFFYEKNRGEGDPSKRILKPVTEYAYKFWPTDHFRTFRKNPTELFVGSYDMNIYPKSHKTLGNVITLELYNTTSMTSLAYRILPSWERSFFRPGGNMRQTYTWTEIAHPFLPQSVPQSKCDFKKSGGEIDLTVLPEQSSEWIELYKSMLYPQSILPPAPDPLMELPEQSSEWVELYKSMLYPQSILPPAPDPLMELPEQSSEWVELYKSIQHPQSILK